MSTRSEMRRVLQWARSNGWDIQLTRGTHMRLTHDRFPGRVIFSASTESDHRAPRNLRAMIKRVERGGQP